MANFGRFVCVLVPFLLTLAALAALLAGGLAGIADKGLYMFRVNVTDLSLSPLSVTKILDGTGINPPKVDFPGLNFKRQSGNISAANLGLNDVYDVNVWNYCYTTQDGKRECTKPAFNWAATALNTTTGDFNNLLTANGFNVTLPKEITEAVKAFGTVSKWTQVVFIIAYIALGVELFFGLFANCSRAFSCVTFLVAGVATVAAAAAAGLATATSVVVVGAVEASSNIYGVDAHFNTRFLATVWLGVAFAIGAGLFWMFTICCCAPDHGSRRSRARGAEAEKFIPGGPGYQRLSEPHGYNGGAGYAQQYPRQSYGAPQGHAGAYEPYSHARV
ncbi:SUR7/PalI family-domain-containing protein [Staphylotrichum tortipilum]|uniref:SUR7/PalI family-domain-containing protein n=1 Tax=Staphylotrichum tortipilum TaxID=2831512 RepID=A0AAN6MRK5_9PEZI|nr:SUR7/PalI family-domain-containing protein [Staphylotrichum longicolle]